MKKNFTLNEKSNGEMAVRRMSEKAQEAYGQSDPCSVYEYNKINDIVYAIKICGDTYRDLSFAEAESILEDIYDEFIAEDEDC